MPGSRDAILDVLENLTADELKKFKLKLQCAPLRDGYGRIPRGALLPMDAVDLTDKLVSFYLEGYGAELTAAVLRDMGLQELAGQLQEGRRKGLGATAATPAAVRGSTWMAPQPAHFVDRHRAALISRVTEVNGVLDALYSRVLSEEQYQQVRAETTNPAKMRRLFSFAPSWDLSCKDLLLQALRDTQPYLVADLEKP